jgi:hypothetical protein
MKKIIGIVIASLMFANIGYAEIRQIESETIGAAHSERYLLSTVCVDGYKFVLAKSGQVHSISMVQLYEGSTHYAESDSRVVPARC